MFKYCVKTLVCLLLLGTASISSAHDSPEHKLQIITEDWAPYNYSEEGELKGFAVEIVQAVMNELGEHYPITFVPGARGEQMLELGPNIMSFSLFRTPEREDKYKWVGPIATQSVHFYKLKNNTKSYTTVEDIKAASSISMPHRGLVAHHVDALGINNVIRFSSREKQFSFLFSGRAELVVNVPELGLPYYLKKINQPVDSLVKTQVKLLEFPLYIAGSQDIPDAVIERWQAALDRVKASPEYEMIYSKYLYPQ